MDVAAALRRFSLCLIHRSNGGWGILALLLGFVSIIYWPAMSGAFVVDDVRYVSGNQLMQAIPLAEFWQFFLQRTNEFEYLPVRDLSYRIEFALYGFSPRGYHLGNLIVYLINCTLVYYCAIKIAERYASFRNSDQAIFAYLAMAFFALHPAHVESVAWISGRKEVLSGLFFLGSVLAYLSGRQVDKKRPWMWLVFSVFLFAMALMSKLTVVSGVLVFALLELCAPSKASTVHERVSKKWVVFAPYALIAGLFLTIGIIQGGTTGVLVADQGANVSLLDRVQLFGLILSQLTAIGLAPVDLRLIYDLTASPAIWINLVLLVTSLVTVGCLIWLCPLQRRLIIIAAGLFYGLLIPYLQLIPFSTWSLASERFLYLPIMGLALVLALVVVRWKKYLFVPALVLLIACSWSVNQRSSQWSDTATLLTANWLSSGHFYSGFLLVADVLVPKRDYDAASQVAMAIELPGLKQTINAYIALKREFESERLQDGGAIKLERIAALDASMAKLEATVGNSGSGQTQQIAFLLRELKTSVAGHYLYLLSRFEVPLEVQIKIGRLLIDVGNPQAQMILSNLLTRPELIQDQLSEIWALFGRALELEGKHEMAARAFQRSRAAAGKGQ